MSRRGAYVLAHERVFGCTGPQLDGYWLRELLYAVETLPSSLLWSSTYGVTQSRGGGGGGGGGGVGTGGSTRVECKEVVLLVE